MTYWFIVPEKGLETLTLLFTFAPRKKDRLVKPDFSEIKHLFLAYPEGFENEYEELTPFFDLLITKIPQEITLVLIVNNSLTKEKLCHKIKRKNLSIIIDRNWNEIWLRDIFGFVNNNYVIKPIYEPNFCNYLSSSRNFRQLNNSAIEIAKEVLKKGVIQIPIKLDGGNFISNSTFAFITGKVFRDNDLKEDELKTLIKDSFGLIPIIIPTSKNDVVGHSDGYMSFISETVLCISQYPKMDSFKEDNKYLQKLEELASGFDIRIIPIYERPLGYSIKCECDLQSKRKCCTFSANGVYVNFLRLNNTIILPEYTLPTLKETQYYNSINELELSRLGFQVIKINCDQLANHGGVLRCLSFTA